VLDVLRLTTMERIVLRAPAPVLIAHSAPERLYTRVLAPTDFSRASAESLIVAARLAPGADFHAVHALQMPLGAIFNPGSSETEAALAHAEDRMRAFLETPGLPALAEPPVIVPGGVHQVLEFRRQDLGADLIAIGANPGPDPKVLGNYARDLMRAPHADLLVAKPPVA
jgi:nucleotide-binding universal stress UspA family protein